MTALQKTPEQSNIVPPSTGGSSDPGTPLSFGWKVAIGVAAAVIILLIFTATK